MIITDTCTQSEALKDFYRAQLTQDVIPFWFPRAIDQQFGGFLHCFDADGAIVDTDKSVWAQGRMAWMLLTLFNRLEKNSDWLTWGTQGIEFLLRHGVDTDGRMFFHLAQNGQPIRKRRYAYSEAFAAIACGALFHATDDPVWKSKAEELFQQYLRWNFTPGLMPPKFCATRPMTGIGPRMIAIATAQALRSDLGPHAEFQAWIDRSIDEIATLFVKHDRQAVMEMVAEDGAVLDHFDGRMLNPGHSIEAAWFILEEGRYRNDQSLIDLGCQMVDYSWHRGWDELYGGMFYFRDVDHRPVQEYWHDMKFWWTHNETIIATLMAYLLTGNEKYAHWHRKAHNWSFTHFADPEHGEWFGYLHRDGSKSSSLKGGLWKSFFHHPRMLWKCWSLLSTINASTVEPQKNTGEL